MAHCPYVQANRQVSGGTCNVMKLSLTHESNLIQLPVGRIVTLNRFFSGKILIRLRTIAFIIEE